VLGDRNHGIAKKRCKKFPYRTSTRNVLYVSYNEIASLAQVLLDNRNDESKRKESVLVENCSDDSVLDG
jgi:hypothetical protein